MGWLGVQPGVIQRLEGLEWGVLGGPVAGRSLVWELGAGDGVGGGDGGWDGAGLEIVLESCLGGAWVLLVGVLQGGDTVMEMVGSGFAAGSRDFQLRGPEEESGSAVGWAWRGSVGGEGAGVDRGALLPAEARII